MGLKENICSIISGQSDNVSETYTSYCANVIDKVIQCSTQKIMLFVNGYRLINANGLLANIDVEFPDTDNSVKKVDVFDYWSGMDKKFRDVRKSDLVYYLDGHMSISTSNHGNMSNFAQSYRSSACARYYIDEATTVINQFINEYVKNPWAKAISSIIDEIICPNPPDSSSSCYHNNAAVQLSTIPNKEGFDRRKAQGYIAGMKLYSHLINDKVASMDTIDIVCHSMGFAYAQGIIETLKESGLHAGLGGYYIIAPENACSGEVNLSEWQQVWQYGTDEENTDKWMQDGVAPQCMPNGISRNNRAFIPDDVPQGFVTSHSVGNYEWIFTQLFKGQNGYVIPRK
jgi:hypothetical protein